MTRYVIKRVLQALVVLWAAYTVSFFILTLLPGDPVSAMAGAGSDSSTVDPALIEKIKHQYGFDKPVLVQYLSYLGQALQGNFGTSVATGRPVSQVVSEAVPATFALAGAALLLAVVFGGFLAIAATYTSRRWLRQFLMSLPPLGVSVPTFWIGLMLVELFSFKVRLFPAFGNNGLVGLVLPAITLAIPTGALFAQVLTKSLLTTLGEPYVETAKAKGAGRVRVHLRHALRNASLPALTVLGVIAGQLLASAVVVETVFARSGLGRVTQGAVTAQDLPVVQGVVVLGALIVIVVNLTIDLVYPLLDPRIVLASRQPKVA
jgi:peptide/nickel transport system permease protein